MHREKLRLVVDAVRPELLLHGHFHSRYEAVLTPAHGRRETRIVGLDRDDGDMTAQAVVLDTGSLEIEPLVGAEQLRRVRAAMAAAGVAPEAVDPGNMNRRWRQHLREALAGRCSFSLFDIAAIAEACDVTATDLQGE